MTFRKVFRGKSANTPGFLVAVLNAVGLLEPEGEKKRVHLVSNNLTAPYIERTIPKITMDPGL